MDCCGKKAGAQGPDGCRGPMRWMGRGEEGGPAGMGCCEMVGWASRMGCCEEKEGGEAKPREERAPA